MMLGVWLVVVGLCDLLRAARDTTSARRRVLLIALGLCLLVAAGIWLGLDARWWWAAELPWAAGLVAWLLASSVALDPSSRRRAWRAAAFAAFGLPFAGFLIAGDAMPAPSGGPAGTLIDHLGTARTVLLSGVLLLQLSTGNLLVRLLLDAVGVPAQSHEKELKGGRLLGPMERLFILVLAVANQLTAASVVVAAKGLLRWPELRSAREEGPSEVSEYFLIGSFASWLVALVGWLVVRIL